MTEKLTIAHKCCMCGCEKLLTRTKEEHAVLRRIGWTCKECVKEHS